MRTQSVRLVLVFILTFLLFFINWIINGTWAFPSDDKSILFQNGLLLIAFGSLLFEDKFTKPVDSFNNCFVVTLTLFSVNSSKFFAWDLIFGYCLTVMLLSAVSIFLGDRFDEGSKLKRTVDSCFYLSRYLGKATRVFSFVFLCALVSFYSLTSNESKLLLIFWGAVMLIEPFKIPVLIARIFSKEKDEFGKPFGEIVRFENPNIVICRTTSDKKPGLFERILVKSSTGNWLPCIVIGEFVQDSEMLIKAFSIAGGKELESSPLKDTKDVALVVDEEEIKVLFGELSFNQQAFLGLVCENSQIGKLFFEYTSGVSIEEGALVSVKVGSNDILYQIVDGQTKSEAVEGSLHGFIRVEAIQLGKWESESNRFEKFSWMPELNTPVYLTKEVAEQGCLGQAELKVGEVPNGNFPVIANIDDLILHHLVISGVTGSGKTTLALNITDSILKNGYKVFCVDISGDYEGMLNDLEPEELTLSKEMSNKLARALEEVETGEYGAKKEKEALLKLEKELKEEILDLVTTFIKSDKKLGLLQLKGISNTSANIYLTGIYLGAIFHYAKENRDEQKYSIVLEEAHTIIPEASTLGVTDTFSRGIVGRMSQIALQGRKYNVGLMILTQRTANVTKTILTQCNSVIVFSLYDQTSLDFFSNHFGSSLVNTIPNLKMHHAIVSGKGFKSARPVIMKALPPRAISKAPTAEENIVEDDTEGEDREI